MLSSSLKESKSLTHLSKSFSQSKLLLFLISLAKSLIVSSQNKILLMSFCSVLSFSYSATVFPADTNIASNCFLSKIDKPIFFKTDLGSPKSKSVPAPTTSCSSILYLSFTITLQIAVKTIYTLPLFPMPTLTHALHRLKKSTEI